MFSCRTWGALTSSDDLYFRSGVFLYDHKGLLPIERIHEPSYSFTTGFKPDTIQDPYIQMVLARLLLVPADTGRYLHHIIPHKPAGDL